MTTAAPHRFRSPGARRRALAALAGALAACAAAAQQRAEPPRPIVRTVRSVRPAEAQPPPRAGRLDLSFATRADEDPAGARITVAFAASPGPGAEPPRALEVVVDDERLGLVPVEPGAVRTLTAEAGRLAARNGLSLRLLDGAGRPMARRSAWDAVASVEVALESVPAPLPDDLALLPVPFIDRAFDRAAVVPLALPAPATAARIRAAALVASWMALDAPLAVSVEAQVGRIPDGRAVVLLDDPGQARALGLDPLDGPAVRMADHPGHPGSNAKLLVVGGRTPAELARAAEALAARPPRLVGREAHLAPAPPAPPAAPYSAPWWLPAGRAVPFRDFPLGGTPAHDGATSATLPVRFRLPPDLAVWPADAVEVDLGWQERVPEGTAPPRLDLELNGFYVAALPPPDGPGPATRWTRLRIPRQQLRGYNELLLHVKYPEPSGDAPAAGARVAVSGDSVLHLEGLRHFAALPDVATFAYDGYPFTRVPDLGETAVVLPARPGAPELSAALTLAAGLAQVTGRAGTRATYVAGDPGDAALAGKDLLLVGAAGEHELAARWAGRWPVELGEGAPRLRPARARRALLELTGGLGPILDRRRARAVLAGGGALGAIMGIESPASAGRCAVRVTGRPLPPWRDFLGYAEGREPSGNDLLLLSGGRRFMFRLGPGFTAGRLGPVDRVRWFFAGHWLLLTPILLAGGWLLSAELRRLLSERMQARLAPGGGRP
ncbi:cellulose biosynthesis cyclic di-GMP-binding regulatory protein BcsB [Anaeromyxobacter paludicola]|uniref:Cyclic di-GMP-binding protein n=1 Tax=Anaeromyxobacter paludicola TaxID=2918171 RepID=A0ABM7X925_9BACT|nr:cellulose biosynthesis cyclic di-GMP-binding regulatory protein BcsB [Anaeromyxobacter paludicola]BDG08353.1 hypothetical protein AMPC_14660 [Anaeromyxobacter paludicola]